MKRISATIGKSTYELLKEVTVDGEMSSFIDEAIRLHATDKKLKNKGFDFLKAKAELRKIQKRSYTPEEAIKLINYGREPRIYG